MNNQKTIAFDVHGTLDNLAYTGFLLCIIEDLLDLNHKVIVWSSNYELAKDFVMANFLPEQGVQFMTKIKRNQDSSLLVDIAIDDDPFSVHVLHSKHVLLIQDLPKRDKESFDQISTLKEQFLTKLLTLK
jgi:hypothetical protein